MSIKAKRNKNSKCVIEFTILKNLHYVKDFWFDILIGRFLFAVVCTSSNPAMYSFSFFNKCSLNPSVAAQLIYPVSC